MTSKIASEVLKASSIKQMGFCKVIVDGKSFSVKEALDIATKALEQEPCDDAISRQKAILQVQKYGVGCFDAEDFSPEQCERFVISKLNSLPSVTPKEKTGHWIFDDKCREHGHCSECGYGSIDLVNGEPHDFCRRCGAKMIESQESEGSE